MIMNTVHEDRPWGSFDMFTHNELSTVKLIYVNKGEVLSLQYHQNREEFWRVIFGNPEITIGQDKITASAGQDFIVPKGVNHRISAPNDDVVILEISKGDFDENDIIRIEDKYNRVS